MKRYLAILVCFLGLLALGGCSGDTNLPESRIVESFARDKAMYERLASMLRADAGLTAVDETWTEPRDPASVGVGEKRIAEYRALFKSLGLGGGVRAYGSPIHNIGYIHESAGLAVSGYSFGVEWRSETPENGPYAAFRVVQNISDTIRNRRTKDGHGNATRESLYLYRHLEGQWYLYYSE